ncbi:hypothetical protein ACFVVM_16510 [Nocardia sp. NPDC058176]
MTSPARFDRPHRLNALTWRPMELDLDLAVDDLGGDVRPLRDRR